MTLKRHLALHTVRTMLALPNYVVMFVSHCFPSLPFYVCRIERAVTSSAPFPVRYLGRHNNDVFVAEFSYKMFLIRL
jgi:hypothetical protein